MLLSKLSSCAALLELFAALSGVSAQNANTTSSSNHTKVLILGAGMTGVIAARTLHQHGIEDFILLDARTELGGRMIQKEFGVPGRQFVVEMGPNWVQGTQQGNGTANPIWELALKHNLTTAYNDLYGSMYTYDDTGYNNYTDVFNDAVNNFNQATVVAGQQLLDGNVDLSFKSAYSLMSMTPRTPQEVVGEYYQIDWECKLYYTFVLWVTNLFNASLLGTDAQSPSQTSWLAASWSNNFTYVAEYGGFSEANQLCIDQRGFSYIVQAEAAVFLQPQQVVYNQTINLIEYGGESVTVHTTGGMTLTADHVLCTFSVGVLQNEDVVFQPSLPHWKVEAINSIEMATYTKIFLQFNETFWFPTEMALYAAKQRGKYPVWQSLDHVGFFPGSGIMFVTVTGDWSEYVEQLTESEVQSEVMEVLRKMYPNITIPEPVAILMPIWHLNPLFRGSYSNWGPSYVPAQSENLKATLKNHLWFAGEATSVKYFGYLQSAYYEGESAGSAIAVCIQGNGTCGFPSTAIPKNAQPYESYLTDLLPSGLPS